MSKYNRIRIKKCGDLVLPDWVPSNILEEVNKEQFRKDDVIITTYPKAGTTWMLQIIHLLMNDGQQGKIPLNEVVGWIERDSLADLKRSPAPKIIKTHLPPHYFENSRCKMIYVARNPKDLAVSYFYHARAKKDFGFLGDWDTFFELFINGEVEGGDWWEHTRSGLDIRKKNPKKSLFIWYENLYKNPIKELQRITNFLEKPIKKDMLKIVEYNSRLEQMKKSPLTNVTWTKERDGESPHLREGAVGKWRTLFTHKQEQVLEKKWQELAIKCKVHIPRTPEDVYRNSSLA